MLKAESLKKYIDEVIAEIEQELDEATTTGDIAGYDTPNAFSDGSDATKRRKKKIATQLGMQLVGKVESVNEASTSFVSGNSGRTITNLDNKKYQLTKDVKGAQIGNYTNVVLPKGSIIYNLPGGVFVSHPSLKDKFSGIKEIPKFGFRVTTHSDTILTIEKSSKILESISEMVITEKQFKGLDGIPTTTSLAKITKDQKLKIIKGVGNIIDFIVPKGVSRNFWQVIGTGKVKKNLSGEYYLEGKMINSPMFKSMDDLINGVKWNSMEERRRFNESINENRWLELKNDDSMHANKKLAVGLKELKNQLSEVEKFFRWYNQIKTMNELDSNQYWKRTNSHIYKIKERIINIARTLQEIEK
jgi:hypothetical protein